MARKQNPEVQAAALHKATQLGMPLKQVAAEAGVSLSTLRRWLKQSAVEQSPVSPPATTSTAPSLLRIVLLDQEAVTSKLECILRNEGYQLCLGPLTQHLLGALVTDPKPWLAQARIVELVPAGALRLVNLIERSGKDVPLLFIANAEAFDIKWLGRIGTTIDFAWLTEPQLDHLSDCLDRLSNQRAQRIQLRDCRQHFEQLQRCCYQVFDTAQHPIAILHDSGHSYANPAYMRLFGVTDFAALHETSLTGLLGTQEQQAVSRAMAQAGKNFSALTLDLPVRGADMRLELTRYPGISGAVQAILRPAGVTAGETVATEACMTADLSKADYALWAERVASALSDESLFSIVYQPIVNLKGGTEVCYEALLRMHNNAGGDEYLPGNFMPAAQQAGLMGPIDTWVIRHTAKLIKSETAHGRCLTIFVNISRDSLVSKTFCSELAQLINEYQIDPQSFVFEVPESELMDCGTRCQSVLVGIRALGCGLALDHFSGREAAFRLLNSIEVDFIKLDGTLIRNLAEGSAGRDQILGLARDLSARGKQSIASRVQDAETVALLWQCGVNYVQGYFLQQPSKALDYDFLSDDQEVTASGKF